MRCPSPLCSLRPPDGIGGAGDDSALDRASGVERRLERLGLDGGDDARESPDGPMVRSPESSVDVRCDTFPRWLGEVALGDLALSHDWHATMARELASARAGAVRAHPLVDHPASHRLLPAG